MRTWALAVGLLLSGMLIGGGAGFAPAWSGTSGAGLETQPIIAGQPMRCYDYRGVVVRTLRTSQLGDVGRASIIGRMPVISLDNDRMASLPDKMQVFFYMHECAHHVLGHVIRPTLDSEREADCWSISHGRATGMFARTDVEGFAPHFAKSRGSRFGHLPGPERVNYLLQCFDSDEAEQSAFAR